MKKVENKSHKRNKLMTIMDRLYRVSAPILVGEALLFAALALMMFLNPIGFMTTVTVVVGIALVVFGLYRISMVLVSGNGFALGVFDVVLGFLSLVLGIVFFVYPYDILTGLAYVFILLFLLNALRMLFFGINMMRLGFERYKLELWISIGMLVLVILLFGIAYRLNGVWLDGAQNGLTEILVRALMYSFGGYMLINAAADVYVFLKLLRMRREVRNLKK